MIDYLMKFDNEAQAISDPVVSAYRTEDNWRGDVCIPGATVRQVSTDTLLPFWYVTISCDTASEELQQHEGCVLAVDWDAGEIVHSSIPRDQIADYQVSPVFAGRDVAALLGA